MDGPLEVIFFFFLVRLLTRKQFFLILRKDYKMKPSLKEFCQKFNISESEIVKKKCFSELEQLRMIKKTGRILNILKIHQKK